MSAGWRTWPTARLEAAAREADERGDDIADDYWDELDERDAQAEADAGGMNGVAPQR